MKFMSILNGDKNIYINKRKTNKKNNKQTRNIIKFANKYV